jgi:hypothetical protein
MTSRTILALAACAALASCGGGRDAPPSRGYATGPIQTACLRADRRAADPLLCGCVQAAANASLSARDRNRAVRFYADPHRAQEVRQSDRASDEAFWRRYRAFVSVAERSCA